MISMNQIRSTEDGRISLYMNRENNLHKYGFICLYWVKPTHYLCSYAKLDLFLNTTILISPVPDSLSVRSDKLKSRGGKRVQYNAHAHVCKYLFDYIWYGTFSGKHALAAILVKCKHSIVNFSPIKWRLKMDSTRVPCFRVEACAVAGAENMGLWERDWT